MGHGKWDDNAYAAAKTFRAAKGIADFGYTASIKSQPRDNWKAAKALDPFKVALRECRDSPDHADSTPIAVLFDVTGSMGSVPRIMQGKLGKLHGLLQRKGYLADPQLMFGGIGDADSDRVPLQVGQFESDNRMDEQLRDIFLEGNGGGQKSESYELAAYFVARHVVTDAWQKRGRKGYLFIIGDELNKPRLEARHIRRVIGDDVNQDIDPVSVYRELAKKWNVYFILPNQSSYFHDDAIAEHWRAILGQNFLKLDDPGAVCELIAATIGMEEQVVDLDQALVDLAEIGSVAESRSVGKALVAVGAAARPATAAPLAIDGPDDVTLT
ncbi:hypothetical protein BBK82_19995 [Lentzea guizhouensis]|uniref:VWFA domain-containing protein n=1 Tax=Lentzea guizhouensis TaxID=1586287 RepID=A0A1B2HJY7_9PSEU|nr:hypothetical protein [Lentzea guizhouensis]ANZ38000.1 hypothetical protein BBK82_19995 [Lentzea guizhouensis]